MKNKILILFAVGFALGIVITLVVSALLGSDGFNTASERFYGLFGNRSVAVLVSLLLPGVYAALCMGGAALYAAERLPPALATAIHYVIVSGGFVLVAWALGWSCFKLPTMLIIEGFMAAGFILIWLIMYFHSKAMVKKINEQIEKNKDKSEE